MMGRGLPHCGFGRRAVPLAVLDRKVCVRVSSCPVRLSVVKSAAAGRSREMGRRWFGYCGARRHRRGQISHTTHTHLCRRLETLEQREQHHRCEATRPATAETSLLVHGAAETSKQKFSKRTWSCRHARPERVFPGHDEPRAARYGGVGENPGHGAGPDGTPSTELIRAHEPPSTVGSEANKVKRIKRLVSYYHESINLSYRKSHTDKPYSRLSNRPVSLWLRPPGSRRQRRGRKRKGTQSTCLYYHGGHLPPLPLRQPLQSIKKSNHRCSSSSG